MRRNGQAEILTILFVAGMLLLSLLLPIRALFTGDGFCVPYLAAPEMARMWREIGVLLLWFGGILLLPFSGRQRFCLLVSSVLVFCWLHVVFLPMLVTGCYLVFLLLAGRFLRCGLLRMRGFGGWPSDVMLGSSLVITLFCLLSLVGIHRLSLLRLLCLGLGAVLVFWYLMAVLRGEEDSPLEMLCQVQELLGDASLVKRLGLLFLFLVFLVQAGRINLATDFDTMWYGVRSEYLLNGNGGIYEDPGMVSMVYVYSKGWEILTLPLCDLPSHTFLSFFHIWLLVLGILLTGQLARLSMEPDGVWLSMILTASIPAIVNMSVSAKTDMITWFLQLVMLEQFFTYLKETEAGSGVARGQRGRYGRADASPLLIFTAGAYALSLTMKPSALVFSTAVFGMMGVYLLCSGRLLLPKGLLSWLGLVPPFAALGLVWLRTYRITGMPVTSIFTSIFARLGFQMKYPFAVSALPSNYEEAEPVLRMFVRRLYQLLLAPEGKDMTHAAMAWGSSLLFFLLVVMLLSFSGVSLFRRTDRRQASSSFREAGRLIVFPFLAVNLISLLMLYQIDGNYFMLLYSMILLLASQMVSEFGREQGKELVFFCLLPLLVFNFVLSSMTSWAWSVGFTPIQMKHKGYLDHEARDREWFVKQGSEEIWEILASDPEHRVIAFGEHPNCLQFPCKVQSYRDVTAPWGNVELVNSPEAFEAYMEYAKTDYIYAQAGYLGEENWSWSYGLLQDLIARGSLTDCRFEWGNFLGKRAETPVSAEEAAENLRLFEEQYLPYRAQEHQER